MCISKRLFVGNGMCVLLRLPSMDCGLVILCLSRERNE